MFERPLPRYLDLRKLTDVGGEVDGFIAIDQLPRLAEFAEPGKQVTTALHFWRDEQQRRRITGEVLAPVVMTCQRCLEPVTQQVEVEVNLAVVWSEDDAKQLPHGLEAWITDGEPIETASLLEEEILLALPIVALHDHCQPPADLSDDDTAADETPKDNPFSVLAKLKKP